MSLVKISTEPWRRYGKLTNSKIADSVDRNEFESIGATLMSGAKRQKFCSASPFFGSTSAVSRLGKRFRGGQCSLAVS